MVVEFSVVFVFFVEIQSLHGIYITVIELICVFSEKE